jgi:hypothetical protein
MPANLECHQPSAEPFDQALSALPGEECESPFDRWMRAAEALLERRASQPAPREVSN